MTIGNVNIAINTSADTGGVRSVERALLRLRALSASLDDRSGRNADVLARRLRRLDKIVNGATKAFGAFTSLLAKGFVVALAASAASLLAIKAALVVGRYAAKGFHLAMSGVAAGTAAAAVALSTLAAAQREYAAAAMSYKYRPQNMGFSNQMVSGAALRSFTSNAKLALAGQEALTGAFTGISKSTPVTGQLVKATEALGDFVATTGDMANIAGAGEFLGALVKAGSLTDEVVSSADKLGPAFQDAMKILKDEGKTSAEAVMSELTSGALAAKAGVDGMLQVMNTTLMGTFKRNVQMLRDQFADLGENFLAPASESVDRIGQTLRFTVMRAGYSINQFGQGSVFTSLESGVDKIANLFVDLLDKYLPKTEGFFTKLKDVFNGISDAVKQAWHWMESLEKGGEILFKFLGKAFGGIFTGFNDGLGNLQSLLKENKEPLMEFGQSLREFFAKVSELFGEMRKAFFAALPVLKTLTDALTTLVGAIKGVFGFVAGGGSAGLQSLAALGGMFMLRRMGGRGGAGGGRGGAGGGRGRAGGGIPPTGGGPVTRMYRGVRNAPGRLEESGMRSMGLERNPNTGRFQYREGRMITNAAGQQGFYRNGVWGYNNNNGRFTPYNQVPTARDMQHRLFNPDNYRQAAAPTTPTRGQVMARGAGVYANRFLSSGYAAPGAAMLGGLVAGQIDAEWAGNLSNALMTLGTIGMVGNQIPGLTGGSVLAIAAPFIAGKYAESLGLKGGTEVGAMGSLAMGTARAAQLTPGPTAALTAGTMAAYASGRYLSPLFADQGIGREQAKGLSALGGGTAGAIAGAQFHPVYGTIAGFIIGSLVSVIGSDAAFAGRDKELRESAARLAQRFTRPLAMAMDEQDPERYSRIRKNYLERARLEMENLDPDDQKAYLEKFDEVNKEMARSDKLMQRQIENEQLLAKTTNLSVESIRNLSKELGYNLQGKIKNLGKVINQLLEIPTFKTQKQFASLSMDAFTEAVKQATQPIISERDTRLAVNQAGISLRGAALSGNIEKADVAKYVQDVAAYEIAKAGAEGRDVLSAIANINARIGPGTGALFTGENGLQGLFSGAAGEAILGAGFKDIFNSVIMTTLGTLSASNIGTIYEKFPQFAPYAKSMQDSAAAVTAFLGPQGGADYQARLKTIALGQGETLAKTGNVTTYGKQAAAAAAFGAAPVDVNKVILEDMGVKMEEITDPVKAATDAQVTAIESLTIELQKLTERVRESEGKARGFWDSLNKFPWEEGAFDWFNSLFGGGDDDSSTPKKKGGDTATSRYQRTMSAHRSLNAGIPGNRFITSGIRNAMLGSLSSDHIMGNAYDLVGQNLQAYANATKMNGGFAEFHGAAGTRHLHVVPGMGAPMGDTSSPAMVGVGAGMSDNSVNTYNITVNPSANASAAEIAQEVMVRIERTQRSARERA